MAENLQEDPKESGDDGPLDVYVDPARLEYFMDREGVDFFELARRIDMHYNGALRIKLRRVTSFKGLSKVSHALNCHPFDLLVAQGFPDAFWVAPASH